MAVTHALLALVWCAAAPDAGHPASGTPGGNPDRPPFGAPVAVGPDPLWSVAWRRQIVDPTLLEYMPIEPAGPGVDPVTKTVAVAVRDGKVLGFAPDGTELWFFDGRGPYVATPGFVDDLVVVAGVDGKIFGLDRSTRTIRWKQQYLEEMGSQPFGVAGLVYVATLQGTVLALDAMTGQIAWYYRREAPRKFTILGVGKPTVADGVLYQGFPDGSVVALDARTGTLKWERRVGRGEYADVDSTVQIARGRVFAASYGGQVAALDAGTGQPIWEVRVPYAHKALLEGDTLYVVSTTDVVALRAKDGTERWKTPLEGTPFGEPVIVKGLFAVPNVKGLLILDSRSGKKLRLLTRGSGATGAPAVLGNRVYVLSNAGELVAVDVK
jgi:outer membrane protein assembly factor BamB